MDVAEPQGTGVAGGDLSISGPCPQQRTPCTALCDTLPIEGAVENPALTPVLQRLGKLGWEVMPERAEPEATSQGDLHPRNGAGGWDGPGTAVPRHGGRGDGRCAEPGRSNRELAAGKETL